MKKNFLQLLFCLSASSLTCLGGGFKIGLQGQRQAGMGHTGVGFAQDAATIYFNPAGMSFVGSQINGGFFLLMPSTTFQDNNTNTLTHAVQQVYTPFSAYGQMKLSKRFHFGIGAYTPFGSGVLYPHEWTGRYILHSIELQSIFIQPTLSVKIADGFSIGAGYIFANGRVNLEKDIPVQNMNSTETPHAMLDGKGKGSGFNVGAYLQGSKASFGITYHSKVNMKVNDGQAIFTNIPVALASSFPQGNTFDARLPLPAELAVGTSFKLSHRTTAAIDLNYTFWKSFDSLGFDYAQNSSSLSDTKSPRLYQNAFAIKAGLQHAATKNTTLRLGAWWDETPVQDGYVAPELPDNNKVGLTCGASFRTGERFFFDFSLVYESIRKRNQTNLETGLSGTFQTKVIAPGVGMTFLMQKRTYKRKKY